MIKYTRNIPIFCFVLRQQTELDKEFFGKKFRSNWWNYFKRLTQRKIPWDTASHRHDNNNIFQSRRAHLHWVFHFIGIELKTLFFGHGIPSYGPTWHCFPYTYKENNASAILQRPARFIALMQGQILQRQKNYCNLWL